MKRKLASLFAIAMMSSLFSACAEPAEDLMLHITPSSASVTERTEEANEAVMDFAVRLFRESAETGDNTLVSPLSVLMALSMTANGARENTLAQMEAVLGMPVAQLNEWARATLSRPTDAEKGKLSLANAIWFTDDESFTVQEDFLQTNADFYGAGIYRVPFNDAACRQINDWVKEKTDGMIRDILDEIPSDAVMYLVNALAFDAEWTEIYEKNQVRDGTFTREDGVVQKVQMMHSTEGTYLEDEDAVGFLKYYKGGRYAFAALLPNEGVTVAEYVASLTGERLYQMLANAPYATVYASLPKFETEYDTEMSEVLMNMGMSDAFDGDRADFTGLGTSTMGKVKISRVLHKTYISVGEKGTRAGAATVIEADAESAMEPMEPKTVVLDRPFVYLLIDCETNIPFFIGALMDAVN